MPPDPSEQQFLATTLALVASYSATIPALEAQVAQVDADAIVLTYGDWARVTSDLIATLRELNRQARAIRFRDGGDQGREPLRVRAVEGTEQGVRYRAIRLVRDVVESNR